jgi:ferritin
MAVLLKVLRNALLDQASHELGAFLLYKEASHWFEIKHLKGIAERLNIEAEEEKKHFDDILNYVTKRGSDVEIILPTLPAKNWTTERCAFDFFLHLEKDYAKKFYDLNTLAREHQDYHLESFLSYFIDHQIQSVNEWETRVAKIHSFTAVPGLIWHLDHKFK